VRYRAPEAAALISTDLAPFTALFDRRSGITHILASPAPEILAALTEPMTIDMLLAVLAREYDLADPDPAALAVRLDELVASGLVATT